jgi:hypothetical protein
VRVGVVAERKSGGTPELEDFDVLRIFLKTDGVDEAVGLGDVGVFKGLDDAVGDVDASHAGGEFTVRGEVVEGEGDLLGESRDRNDAQAKG